MVVRVSVVDTDAAAELMQRVRCEVTVAQVEFDAARQEVRIEIEKQPDETLVEVLNLLENWLGASGHPPTSVEIDEHRYVLSAAC
jgi:hypothetical protein